MYLVEIKINCCEIEVKAAFFKISGCERSDEKVLKNIYMFLSRNICIFRIFQQKSMDNPFLNTSHYTVVREYNRITERSRSSSQSSRHSHTSKNSINSNNNASPWLNRSHRAIECEYLLKKNQRKQQQERRARVLGVEQLRYRPEYLKESQTYNQREPFSIKSVSQLQEQTAPQIHIKSDKKVGKSLKSSKSFKVLDNENNNQLQAEPSSKIKNSTTSRRSSVLGTMVNFDGEGNDQNMMYESCADIQSKLNAKPNTKNRKKRSSCFYEQYQDLKRQQKKSSTSGSIFGPSIKLLQSSAKLISNKGIKNEYFPDSVKQTNQERRRRHSLSKSAILNECTEESAVSEQNSSLYVPSSIFIRGRIFFRCPVAPNK